MLKLLTPWGFFEEKRTKLPGKEKREAKGSEKKEDRRV